MRGRLFGAGAALLALALSLGGCQTAEREGDGTDTGGGSAETAGQPADTASAVAAGGGPDTSAAPAAEEASTTSKEAEVSDPELTETPSGLKYKDLEPGSGTPVRQGQTAVVHYTGWLVDGAKFDSSLDRGEPFEFPVGGGRVIRGWDEGVAGMKPGGKRRLVIPPDLGYGAQGAGGVIPPNATLIFEVELLEAR